MLRDIRYALRTFRKSPGVTAIAIVALALGIGATTAIFSLVDGLLLTPLDVPEPDRLALLSEHEEATGRVLSRTREVAFAEWKERSDAFDKVAAGRNMGLSVTSFEEPTNPLMRRVSHGYLEILGASPIVGRSFFAEEDRPGNDRVVILEHDFWQEHFGGDPEAVGQTIDLAYEAYEIVGVLRDEFDRPVFGQQPALYLPMALDPTRPERERGRLRVVARLAPGVGLGEARAELHAISTELETRDPEAFAGRGVVAEPLQEALTAQIRSPLYLLLGAVGLVLLIACGNVANLLLARALGRQREIAVRLALGASRWHLVRQLLAESLLLSLGGAVLGLFIASWSLGPILSLIPGSFQIPQLDRVGIDADALLFAFAAAVATAFIFGLAPLRQAFAVEAEDHLSAGAARAAGNRRHQRLRSGLVVAEIALSMMLLVGAALVVRSFQEIHSIPLGYEPENLLSVRTTARGPDFDDPERWADYFRRVVDEVSAVPGIAEVGLIEGPPIFTQFGDSVPLQVPGLEVAEGAEPRALLRSVSPDYFRAFGTPFAAGRDFTWDDDAEGPRVAIASRILARRIWGEREALEQVVELAPGERYRIVGVVGDVRGIAASPEPAPILYLPYAQRPIVSMSIMARTAGEPMSYLRSVEKKIWGISRDVPVYSGTGMEEMLRNSEWGQRLMLILLGTFATLAVVLAGIGIYGVLSYAVAERRREIGVRLAVGAQRADVLRMVLRSSLRLAAVGIGLGLAVALGLSQLLVGMLFGVEVAEPLTYGAIVLGVLAVALLAAWVPAQRATRVDPVSVLRAD